jgi:DNA-binding transcriptional regulator YiaG
MTTITKTNSGASNENAGVAWKTLDHYEPNIGAPFYVTLSGAVRQKVDLATGKVLETEIPNLGGLLKEVAVARALHSRKFSPADIKFVRKAINLKAVELANLLGISAEHLSRCENEGRTLSPAAEKLLRVIVLKKRFNLAELDAWVKAHAAQKSLNAKEIARLEKLVEDYKETFAQAEEAVFNASIDAVFDPDEEIAFSFYLEPKESCEPEQPCSVEDDRWKRAA